MGLRAQEQLIAAVCHDLELLLVRDERSKSIEKVGEAITLGEVGATLRDSLVVLAAVGHDDGVVIRMAYGHAERYL